MTESLKARWTLLEHKPRANFVEWVTEQAILALCKPGDVALDIGANYGAHTITMLKMVGSEGQVIAFEPNPVVAKHIGRWSLNFPTLRVLNIALADYEGASSFYLCQNAGFSSLSLDSLEKHGQELSEVISVLVNTLDDVVPQLNLPSIDFVKIDVEGAELAVFRGAKKSMTRSSPIVVVEAALGTLRKTKPAEYSEFFETYLTKHYELLSMFGDTVTDDPSADEYQFFLAPRNDTQRIHALAGTLKRAGNAFFDDNRMEWTPYQKFQR